MILGRKGAKLFTSDLSGRGRYELTLQLELPVTYLAEEGMSWPCCLNYLWPIWPRKVWVNPAACITCDLACTGRYELTLQLDLPPIWQRKVLVDPAACITCDLAGRGRYELTLLLELPVTYLTEEDTSWPCCLIYL